MTLTAGTMLSERYRILDQLFAVPHKRVYLAQDCKQANHLVAIKEIQGSFIDEGWAPEDIPELIAAIEREPVLLASLNHPQIPRYYDHFELNDAWYLVMELVDGVDPRHWLEKFLPGESAWDAPSELRTMRILAVGIQLCNVLDYLHTHDPIVLHLDVKPSNVLITPAGLVKLIDFGISVTLPKGAAGGVFWGLTPGYSAPERERDQWTTAQTDIYNLGITLSCLLAGEHAPDDATSERFLPSECIRPPALRSLLMQMTQEAPQRRPDTVRSVGIQLREILNDLHGSPCTDAQIVELLASPRVSYRVREKQEVFYHQGQFVWYQYRPPRGMQPGLHVPAKIISIGQNVEIALYNPDVAVKEQRRLSYRDLWKLTANDTTKRSATIPRRISREGNLYLQAIRRGTLFEERVYPQRDGAIAQAHRKAMQSHEYMYVVGIEEGFVPLSYADIWIFFRDAMGDAIVYSIESEIWKAGERKRKPS